MKTVTKTRGVVRANIAERVKGVRLKRGPQTWKGGLEAISWTATTAGLSGKMFRDTRMSCVEARYGIPRGPHRVQGLSDNGSIYAAAKTIQFCT